MSIPHLPKPISTSPAHGSVPTRLSVCCSWYSATTPGGSADDMIALSIIVPTLNEADGIVAHLAALQPLRRRGSEVIVVDGGSRDDTPKLAAPLADQVIAAHRGRAGQMNTGTRCAR